MFLIVHVFHRCLNTISSADVPAQLDVLVDMQTHFFSVKLLVPAMLPEPHVILPSLDNLHNLVPERCSHLKKILNAWFRWRFGTACKVRLCK